ncbi:MAG TPA: O-antigen ligase family protein [Thermoanaerobaculaceae bacterium]|nr:O-antigen ligase family protein [Thermoanaerobaculaceae bacterium]HRS14713.1 O-antigen ligase family protein [Thermoanaerobaculaceae bacterium]
MGKPGRERPPRAAPSSWLQRLVLAAACGLVVAVPLVWSLAGYEVFRGPKRLLALACWLALAGATLLRAWSREVWRDPWWLAWGGLLAGAVASTPLSGQSLRVLAAALPVAVVAVGWGALRWLSATHRRTVETLVVATAVVEAALAAIFSVPRWRPDGFEVFAYLEGRYAWIGTLGNPADVALFLLLPCLLATAKALTSPGRRLRWALPALATAAAIVATRTVSVVGVLLLGAGVLAWRALPRRSRLPGIAAAAVLVAGVLLATPMRGRLGEVLDQVRDTGWEWLGSGRAAGFGAALGMVASRPLTGVGFGLFEAHSFRHQSENVLAGRARVLGLATGFGEAHNDPLQHAAETGLVGLGLAAAGLWLAWRRARPLAGELPGSGVLVLAAATVSLAQFPLHQAAIAGQWAVLAALALPARALPPPATGWRRAAAALLAASVVAGGWLYLARLRSLAVVLRQAEALDQFLRAGRAPQAQVPELARAALANLEPAARWAPFDWRAALLAGDLAMLAGDPSRAAGHFGRALALAERPETRFDAGMVQLALGNEDVGLAHLERAVRLNPAIFGSIDNPAVARKVRDRLAADGYADRHPWIFEPRRETGSPPGR